MKIIKPLSLGTLHKPFTWRGQHRLVVSALGFFRLGEAPPARLLTEAAQWPLVMSALPPQQALDEVCMKGQAEALALGPLPPLPEHTRARLQVGALDKTGDSFAPLPVDAPARMKHAGSYPVGCAPVLAADADLRLFNQAPEDQRLDAPAWPDGCGYALHHMKAGQPLIAGRLPAKRARAFVVAVDAPADALREVPLRLDTLWFLPAAGLGILAWHGGIEIADSDALDIATLMVAYENTAVEPRSLAHYASVLALRVDPQTAGLHAFNESQLAPARGDAETARLAQAEAAASAQAQAQREARASRLSAMFASVTDKPLDIQASPPPLQGPSAAAIASGDFDLTALMDGARQLADTSRAQAQARRSELRRDHPLPAAPDGHEAPPDWSSTLQRASTRPSPQRRDARRASPTPLAEVRALPADVALQLGEQVKAWVAQGESLAGRDLAGANLRGAQLTGADLSGCLLEGADLSGAQLQSARLDRGVLTGARLQGAQLAGASLIEANLCDCVADGACLDGASLQQARASGASFQGAHGAAADLREAQLDRARFEAACFDRARLDSTLLSHAQLGGSRWHGAQFNRCVGWELHAEGADFTASRWSRSALLHAHLAGSSWRGAEFSRLQGGWSDWRGADLTGVMAQQSGWPGAQLDHAVMAEACFTRCDFGRASLAGAVLADGCFARSLFLQTGLCGVQASRADFFQALLRKADGRDAVLDGANLYQADTTGLRLQGSQLSGVQVDARKALA